MLKIIKNDTLVYTETAVYTKEAFIKMIQMPPKHNFKGKLL